MMIYLLLAFEFFKTGLFAVGGGLATIPFLNEMCRNYDWFTAEQLADMIAVAESTPGPIGVNTATFAGFNAAGILGSLTATLSLVLPSYLIILMISKALEKYRSNPLVDNAFSALRPAATGLIAAACWSVIKVALTSTEGLFGFLDIKAVILFALLMVITNIKKFKKLHPVVFIGIAAVVGIVFQF